MAAIKDHLITMVFMILFFSVGMYVTLKLVEIGVLLPVTFGSLCALIGLVSNVVFSYARTLEKPAADFINFRAAKVLSTLITLSLCALTTVPSVAINDLAKSDNIIAGVLFGIITATSAIASSLFVLLLTIVAVDLIYLSNFIPFEEEKLELMADYESKYEMNLKRYVGSAMDAVKRIHK